MSLPRNDEDEVNLCDNVKNITSNFSELWVNWRDQNSGGRSFGFISHSFVGLGMD